MAESCIIEAGKKYYFVKPNEEVNGAGKISLDRKSSSERKNGFFWRNIGYYKSERRKWTNYRTHLYLGMLNVLLLLLNVVLLVRQHSILFAEKRNETCPVLLPAALAVPCPKGWIGYQRKCYYYSETEGNWTFGSRHCSSHNASLAVIDSQEEMEFLVRYKSPPDHWIGFRKDSGQPWGWVNVSRFPEQYDDPLLEPSGNVRRKDMKLLNVQFGLIPLVLLHMVCA